MNIEGAYRIIINKLLSWAHDLIQLLPNIALATVILVIGFFLAKIVRNGSKKLIHRFITNRTLDGLFSSLIYIFLSGIVIFAALSVLQLDKAVTSILAVCRNFGPGPRFRLSGYRGQFYFRDLYFFPQPDQYRGHREDQRLYG
jgi:hypothetical protein